MFETIYQFLLHMFALIGLVLTILIIGVGRILAEDSSHIPNEDDMLVTKTDRELFDEEN